MTDRSTAEPTEGDGALPGVPARWGRRRLLLASAAVLVAVALLVTLVVSMAGGDDRPVPPGAMPTLGGQFATPPPAPPSSTPAGPVTLPAFSGAPLWTVRLPGSVDDADPPGIAVTDSGYVLVFDEEIVGLSKAGAELWRHRPPKADYLTTRVTGGLVFVGYANPDEDRWPQPQVVVALNVATGKEVWRETTASFWSVTTDTIYLSECYGGQNDHIGDCTLSARDPATNTTRWAVATYASSSVVNTGDELQAAPTPPYLLIGAYPTGRESFILSSHDPATGALMARGFRMATGPVGSVNDATGRTVVTVDDSDDNPADGCQAVVTGFSVSSARQTWQYTARIAKEQDGRRCARAPESVNRGRLAVTTGDGAPSVLNTDTGKVEWSAPEGGAAIAASDTTLLVVATGEDSGPELVAYRVGNATPLWRAPFPGSVDSSTVFVTATTAYVTGYGDDAAGYDLKTGEGWSYGALREQGSPTSFTVCDNGSCRGYAIR